MTDTLALRPYQVEGAAFLAGKHYALLADDMGLGKTPQALRAAVDAGCQRVLVVCPAVVKPQWQAQQELWAPSLALRAVSYNKADELAMALNLGLEPGEFDLLILDEAHMLKGTEAIRSRWVLGKEGLIRHARRCWALTGTPMLNHPGELWTLAHTFGYTKLTAQQWTEKFCTMRYNGYENKPTGANLETAPELREIMSKFTMRRMKSEVEKQLPAVMYERVVVEPGPVDVATHMPEYADASGPMILRDLLRSQQQKLAGLLDEALLESFPPEEMARIASRVPTYRLYTGLQKVKPTVDLVTMDLEADPAYKVVIFTYHRAVAEEFQLMLDPYGARIIYGGLSPLKKTERTARFRERTDRRVLIVNTSTAGTGLDGLQYATGDAIIVEPSWVPGEDAQAVGRLHRIGQTRGVRVRLMAIANSLDARIAAAQERKLRSIDAAGFGSKEGESE